MGTVKSIRMEVVGDMPGPVHETGTGAKQQAGGQAVAPVLLNGRHHVPRGMEL